MGVNRGREIILKNDVVILSKALHFMLNHGEVKMTSGANALADYKRRVDKDDWKRWFPKLDKLTYNDIKKSYKGGYTYLNPAYRSKEVKEGLVYDVNSMYPWAMHYCKLPLDSLYIIGENIRSPLYTVYMCSIYYASLS